jgi:multidrug efflux system outer membrane protein
MLNVEFRKNSKFKIQNLKFAALLLPLAAFASCKMGEDYKAPSVDTPASFGPGLDSKESLADMSWWQLFQDQTLQDLIRAALKGNKDLEIAAANVERYQNLITIASAQGKPQVGAGIGGSATASSAGGSNAYGTGLQMSWELDMFGAIARQTESAQATFFASEENQRAVIVGLIGSVASSYYQLRDIDAQLGITKETIVARTEALRIAEARRRAGLIGDLDLQRFNADLFQSLSDRSSLDREVAVQQTEINVLLGQNPTPVPRGLSLIDQKMPPNPPPGLPSELLRRRPDIRQAEQQMIAANANVGAAIANKYPKVTLTGGVGLMSPDLTRIASGGLNLTQSIFDGGTKNAQEAIAKAEFRAAVANYERSIIVAFKDVQDALVGIQTYGDQIKQQTDQVGALATSTRLAQVRYEGGQSSYLEVVNAQQELYSAQIALSTTRAGYLISYVQLYKALGGGWSDVMPAQAGETFDSQQKSPKPEKDKPASDSGTQATPPKTNSKGQMQL